MKKNLILLVFVSSLTTSCMKKNTIADVTSLEYTIENLRAAMVSPTEEMLTNLVSDPLSYGHSNGVVETKEEFIVSLVSGKYNFLNIDLSEQTIEIIGNIGVVRHNLFAETHDKDKPESTIKLKILLIWEFREGQWKLLARQAVKDLT
jgi:hypothetical protein